MKYFLYYNYGSCIYQDHEADLEVFDTLGQAVDQIRELKDRDSDVRYTIVRGEEEQLL